MAGNAQSDLVKALSTVAIADMVCGSLCARHSVTGNSRDREAFAVIAAKLSELLGPDGFGCDAWELCSLGLVMAQMALLAEINGASIFESSDTNRSDINRG